MPSRLLLLGCAVPVRQTSHLALSSKFRPRLDQERRHSGGDQHCDRDSRKSHLIASGVVVDRAGEKRAEDRAPGVKEVHIAADGAERFTPEEVAHGCPINRDRRVEHAVETG